MRYLPYDALTATPNIIVDGTATPATVLTLSHWRGAGTPEALADDLSTQIAFRYLDRPDLHVAAEAVSNNHFDEDGLCGIFAVLQPGEALRRRDLVIDVAGAGDFGVYRTRDGLRAMLAIAAYGDEERSPMPAETFARPYPQQCALLYEELLGRLPEMLDDPEHYRVLWEEEDARVARDEARLRSGAITIEEDPAIDLAVVTVAGGADVHEIAIYNATSCFRVLTIAGERYRLRYRYETWVRYVSRPTLPRVDLSPLAATLNAEETAGSWSFEGVEALTPSLVLTGDGASSIGPDRFRALVAEHLRR